ncbi:hypothetical protein [Caudoviricetes sp.]|nr:hypothetical protein [Caudoviricetes sp.]
MLEKLIIVCVDYNGAHLKFEIKGNELYITGTEKTDDGVIDYVATALCAIEDLAFALRSRRSGNAYQ